MNEAEQQTAHPELDEADVAAYLQAHPEFLKHHPDVLEALEVGHHSGNAVSLIERQVDALRTTNRQLQARFNELVDTARGNEQRVVQLNRLARVLVAAESADVLVRELDGCLATHLDVDRTYIGIESDGELAGGAIHALAEGGAQSRALTNVFRRGKPICGPLSAEQSDALFASDDDSAAALASAAMIPLGTDGVHGALVLASQQSARFVPDVGTLFLELMGELVTVALRRLLGSETLP